MKSRAEERAALEQERKKIGAQYGKIQDRIRAHDRETERLESDPDYQRIAQSEQLAEAWEITERTGVIPPVANPAVYVLSDAHIAKIEAEKITSARLTGPDPS